MLFWMQGVRRGVQMDVFGHASTEQLKVALGISISRYSPMNIDFDGKLWFWKGPAPWYFVTVPEQQCHDLKAILKIVTYGWGMIPVTARIGKTEWKTSLFPKDDHYIVPIKASVRKAEKLEEGDIVTLELEVSLKSW